jgi:hypothetical protein
MVSLFVWLGFSGPSHAVYRLDDVNGLVEADRQIFLRLFPMDTGPIVLDPRLFSWINIGKTSIVDVLTLDGADGLAEGDRQTLLRLYRLPASGSGGGAFGGRKRFSWLGLSGPSQAAFVMDGVVGGNSQDRKHWMGLYRLDETVVTPGTICIPALVRFNRLGAM